MNHCAHRTVWRNLANSVTSTVNHNDIACAVNHKTSKILEFGGGAEAIVKTARSAARDRGDCRHARARALGINVSLVALRARDHPHCTRAVSRRSECVLDIFANSVQPPTTVKEQQLLTPWRRDTTSTHRPYQAASLARPTTFCLAFQPRKPETQGSTMRPTQRVTTMPLVGKRLWCRGLWPWTRWPGSRRTFLLALALHQEAPPS